MNIEELESMLDTYSLEEILELNDLTMPDALEFMIEEDFIRELPNPRPVTAEEELWDDTLNHELLDEL